MGLIKAFLVGAIGLFIIITLFSLLIPSNVRVSRAVMINNTSSGEVYSQIVHFDNWKKWHPIVLLDSATLNSYPSLITGNDSGCVIVHRGKKVTIHLLTADSTAVKFLLQSAGENDIHNEIVITDLPAQNAVQVEWRAIITLDWYPWEKFYGIFIDNLTGPGYEAALNGLKEYIE
jgi:hypothetical protein